MELKDYLKNKDINITNDDFDISALENKIREGYLTEKDVQTRIDSAVKEAIKKATNDYSTLETNYNDTVKNLNASNEKNVRLNLQMKMMEHGFKKENFDEIEKLRASLYADEKDDEKAISSIAEKFKGTYFEEKNKPETPPDGQFGSNGRNDKKEIKITRNTSINDLVIRK